MATKNLARTVIEGGRTRWSKYQRRSSNRSARRNQRQYTHSLRFDLEQGENTCAPTREFVWRSHYDRLSAAERWLASFVGRPWSDARAEIARHFDTRTIAGQHIVFDHLLPSVRGGGSSRSFGRHDFEIDGEGILRALPPRRYRPSRKLPPGKVHRSPREIARWSQDRRVAKRGPCYFWFEATERVETEPRFRQTHLLSLDEVRYFEELVCDVQTQLLLVFEKRSSV